MTHRSRVNNILRKEDALELDDEKVDELLNILGKSFETFARDRVVLLWSEGRGKTLRKDQLANKLGGRSG